jgi:uncharacterized membrane protein
MANCVKCGAALTEGAVFCGSCGASVAAGGAPAAAGATSSGLTSNVAGALAYFTIIPAIIFLVAEPYNKDKFIRFHAFQCLFLAAASFVLFLGLGLFSIIPVVGWIVGLLLMPLLGLAMFGIVVFTMYKAYNNEKFMLPVIGKLADQQAAR